MGTILFCFIIAVVSRWLAGVLWEYSLVLSLTILVPYFAWKLADNSFLKLDKWACSYNYRMQLIIDGFVGLSFITAFCLIAWYFG